MRHVLYKTARDGKVPFRLSSVPFTHTASATFTPCSGFGNQFDVDQAPSPRHQQLAPFSLPPLMSLADYDYYERWVIISLDAAFLLES